MKRIRIIKLKKYLSSFFGIVVGTFIMAVSTNFFLLPNKLSTGGFSGIATIMYYVFNVPVGTAILVLNIPLLIIAFFRVGKEFFIKSIIGTFLLSFFIDFLQRDIAFTKDRLLASIYGGIIMGIGTGIILKVNSSTGGSDLLSLVIKSYKKHFQTGNLIVIIDTIIVTISVIVFKNIEIGLYSAIAIYLMGKMMYKKDDKMMLFCVGSRNDIRRMKDLAIQIDKKAFIVICNAREAFGNGFKIE